MAIRPWSAIPRNASRALASRAAHHQYPRKPTQITIPGITINGWANNHSLGSGFVKSERTGRIETARGITQATHPERCENHDGENQPLRCQTRNRLRGYFMSAFKRLQSFGPIASSYWVTARDLLTPDGVSRSECETRYTAKESDLMLGLVPRERCLQSGDRSGPADAVVWTLVIVIPRGTHAAHRSVHH